MSKKTVAMTATINAVRLSLIESGYEARPHTYGRLLVTGDNRDTEEIAIIAQQHGKISVSKTFYGVLVQEN